MSLRLPKSTLVKLDKKDVRKGFIQHHKLLLNPTLFRGKFVKEAVKVMTDKLNPESQLVSGHAKKTEIKKGGDYHADQIEDLLSRWDHSVYGRCNQGIIRDIGNIWRRKNGIKRKYDFMKWKNRS